jgi:hypothetical protein
MTTDASDLKSLFLLDPEVIFLNHGSFGACPRPVFEVYQAWQRELERQTVEFLGRRAPALMAEARQSLADHVGARADEVVYFPNPTTAANMVARSLDLQPGDEVLSTDHEYGAMDRTWRFLSRQGGWSYVRRRFPCRSYAQRFSGALLGRRNGTHSDCISQPPYQPDRVDLSGERNLSPGAGGWDSEYCGRRPRAGSTSAELSRIRSRPVPWGVPQVGALLIQRAIGFHL